MFEPGVDHEFTKVATRSRRGGLGVGAPVAVRVLRARPWATNLLMRVSDRFEGWCGWLCQPEVAPP